MSLQASILCLITSAVVLTGCYTPDGRYDRTAGGALAGGAIGAGTGAIIGNATHRGGEGALIGGAIGALSGAIIGGSIDDAERQHLHEEHFQAPPRTERGEALTLVDIKALTAADVSDEVIISQIRSSRTVYRLSANDIIDLHDAGVSNKVIDFMINTPSLYPPRRYYY